MSDSEPLRRAPRLSPATQQRLVRLQTGRPKPEPAFTLREALGAVLAVMVMVALILVLPP